MGNSSTETRQLNFGPSRLVVQLTDSRGQSKDMPAICSPNWYSIQKYVQDGLNLPTTMGALKIKLGGVEPPDDLNDLITAYSTVNAHCTQWNTDTYPAIVKLASDIYLYGKTTVPSRYQGLKDLANKVIQNPTDPDAAKNFKDALTILQNQANLFKTNCETAQTKINKFRQDTIADHDSLLKPLSDRYTNQYDLTGPHIQWLIDDIKKWQDIYNKAKEDYDKDVTIAATTPTYAWIPFYGWIAAPIVAGIYGSKAVEAKHDMENAQSQINSETDQLKRDQNLYAALSGSLTTLNSIMAEAEVAITVLNTLQNHWQELHDDIAYLVEVILETEIAQAASEFINSGIDDAITQWQMISACAHDFQQCAWGQFTAVA